MFCPWYKTSRVIWNKRYLFWFCWRIICSYEKEEDELFPYLLSLIDNTSSFKSNFSNNEIDGNILVKDLIKDHENEGEKYRRISELTNNFTTPDDGCTTYNIALLSLKEFQSDLHLHVHLENNILFPRAVMLETIKTEELLIRFI